VRITIEPTAELKEEGPTVQITIATDCSTATNFIRDLVAPAMLGLGYSQKSISAGVADYAGEFPPGPDDGSGEE